MSETSRRIGMQKFLKIRGGRLCWESAEEMLRIANDFKGKGNENS